MTIVAVDVIKNRAHVLQVVFLSFGDLERNFRDCKSLR